MKRPLCLICLVLSTILIFIAPYKKSNIDSYEEVDGKPCSYIGKVTDIQYKKSYGNITKILYLSGRASDSPNIIVYTGFDNEDPKIGSYIEVKGTGFCFGEARNEGMFDSLTYYNSIGYSYGIKNGAILKESSSYNRFLNSLYQVRKYLSQKLDLVLPEEEASIIKTMILGQKKEVDSELKDLYMRNGIAHILSISGLHISLIGLGLFKLLKRIGVRHNISAILSSIIVLLYGLMAGLSVSSIRAIGMFVISMGAILFGRAYDILTSVSLFALFLMLSNSLIIYNSSYIFSFGIIYGIAIISPTLTSVAPSENKLSFGCLTALNSLSMSVITLPIYYYCYYQVPIYSILLNFMVLPVMSILMAGGFVMLIICCINVSLAKPLSFLIIGILKIFKELALFFDTLPFHFYTPGRPKLWQIILFISVSVILYFLRKRIRLYIRWGVMLFSLLILTLRFYPSMEICMLDVGQGESIFLRNSSSLVSLPGISTDFTVLIDGGSTDVSKVGEYRIIPFLKFKGAATIDAIFVSHTDKDHVNGLFELFDQCGQEGISIKSLILPRINSEFKNDCYRELEDMVVASGISILYFSEGDSLVCGELSFECLWPSNNTCSSNINDDCMVLLAQYLSHSMLFTGDITSEVECQLNINSPVGILKVPHHGSKYSSGESFLQKLSPSISIISSGINNQYGHPHQATLDRLNNINTVILRTDLLGQLTFRLSAQRDGSFVQYFGACSEKSAAQGDGSFVSANI